MSDIIDLHFVLSDLKDIPISEAEAAEAAYFDALASHVTDSHQENNDDIPLGKTVI